MSGTQRLHGLDFLRASMMLLGIVLHGAQMYMTMNVAFDYYRDPMSSPVMDGLLIFINTFRMPVFFFLSGFFTALLYQRYAIFGMLENRFKRIVLPFVILLPPLALVLSLQWISASQLLATGALGLDSSHVPYPHLLYNNTHHLWFLYYLMYILAGTVAVVWIWERLPSTFRSQLGQFFAGVDAGGPLVIGALGITAGCMALSTYFGRIGGGIVFAPYGMGIAFFALCFWAGWGLWYRQASLATLERRCWHYLVIATAFFAIALAAFFTQGDRQSPLFSMLHPVLALGNGLSVAFYVAGLTGLFSRYFSGYNPRIRYLSDSAYWVYILHQPALLLFAVPMYHWVIPAQLKFLIACAGTALICLWTYDLLVRNTGMGMLLNGRKYPRGLPESTA